MRKTVCLFLCILFIVGGVQYSQAASTEPTDSPLAWLMGLYGFDLPSRITDEMQSFFNPLKFDCGTVQITLQEVLYDGKYLYTSAYVLPADPITTLIMPGSALIDDFVAGGYRENLRNDPRSFLDAASQDQKTLIIVSVYPEEHKQADYYFLDHRQDAGNQSTVFSGAPVGWIGEAPTIHLSVEIELFDPSTGLYTQLDPYVFPVNIQRVSMINYEE